MKWEPLCSIEAQVKKYETTYLNDLLITSYLLNEHEEEREICANIQKKGLKKHCVVKKKISVNIRVAPKKSLTSPKIVFH